MSTIIRSSSLPSYVDCPRRWAAQALIATLISIGFDIKKSLPKSIGASIGTATHGGVAYILTEKMSTGELGNQIEAEHRALEELRTAMQQDGVLWDETSPNLSDSQKQIARMIKSYRRTLAPTINPIAIERRLQANVGDGFVLSGQSDTQAIEPDIIRDTKTGRHHRTHYAQLGSYSLLARTVHPEHKTKGVCTDFIPRVTLKKEQPDPITEFYDQGVAESAAHSTIDRIKADVAEFTRRVEAGNAPPEHAFLANPGSNLCNPKFCPAHGSNFCREHKKTI